MGRSVWVSSNAVATVYRWLDGGGFCENCDMLVAANSEGHCDECGGELEPDNSGEYAESEMDFLLEDIRSLFGERFPSMETCDHWPERESHAVMENKHCTLEVSEYCGMVSISVALRPARWDDATEGLARAWIEKNAAPFLRKHFDQFRKIGTFSNGESVYQAVQP